MQEKLLGVRGEVTAALDALREGLERRQSVASAKALLELMQDTAHVMSKVIIPAIAQNRSISPRIQILGVQQGLRVVESTGICRARDQIRAASPLRSNQALQGSVSVPSDCRRQCQIQHGNEGAACHVCRWRSCWQRSKQWRGSPLRSQAPWAGAGWTAGCACLSGWPPRSPASTSMPCAERCAYLYRLPALSCSDANVLTQLCVHVPNAHLIAVAKL